MAVVIKDRVKVTTTTTGTGTYTLGSAVTGYRDFSVIGDGNQTHYAITDNFDWEVGIGTYTASGTTLSRDTILESSNSNNAVNWASGSKTIFATYSSQRAIYVDGTDVVSPNNAVLGVANGGTGASSLTANNVILGDGTSPVQFVAPGTSGNVLTSNGTTWTSSTPSETFPSGSKLLFRQTAAPTGWTKDTSNYNNHAIRVVTGTAATGGTQDFTTAFTGQTVTGTISASGGSVGSTTLAMANLPFNNADFNHTTTNATNWYFVIGGIGNMVVQGTIIGGVYRNGGAVAGGANSIQNPTFTLGGGGGSHTHGAPSGSTGFTGSTLPLAVKYFDVITATKN